MNYNRESLEKVFTIIQTINEMNKMIIDTENEIKKTDINLVKETRNLDEKRQILKATINFFVDKFRKIYNSNCKLKQVKIYPKL